MVNIKKKKVEQKQEVVLTDAQKAIWNVVRDRKVEYFGLKGQKVSDVCDPLNIVPTELFVALKAGAALQSLEAALSEDTVVNSFGETVPKFVVELVKEKVAVVKANKDAY
jgi:hypothetical protein